MIKELVQFVNDIPPLVKERAVEPKAGLHILIRFDEGGNAEVVNSERFERSEEVSSFISDCLKRLKYAWMVNEDTNKCLSKTKDIHSVSPFCIGFKRESWKGGDFYDLNKQGKSKPGFSDRIEDYFSRCIEPPYNEDESVKQKGIQFKQHLKTNLESLLDQFDLSEFSQNEYIILYNEVDLDEYQKFYASYLAEKLFNTSGFNLESNGEILGTSNFYNGFNSKKPFLLHQTASFDITSRISASNAKALSEFELYAGKKLFPNPIPIFIDKPDLTKDAIQLHHRSEDHKMSHREIISELWKRQEDIGNYYLLYFSGGAIQDFEYVSKFRYLLNDKKDMDGGPEYWTIENVTEIKDKERNLKPAINLKSVFDFELVVIRELFNEVLIRVYEKSGDITNNYFSEIKGKARAAILGLTLKYRKPIYDFIYKSMQSSIRGQQFYDICMTGIMDDIRNHESKRDAIKPKLNIFFSLYQYFDKINNQQIMPSKIEEHKAEIAKVVDEVDTHFTTDEAYAFGAGQLIYFLLSRSEAGERTHAVLEPFLQKTSHSHFNDAIAAILMKYKHAIGFDYKRFNQLAGEVLDYAPTVGLQQLRPFLLAGYFCPNILFTKKSDTSS